MHSSACAPDHVVGFRSVFFLDWHNHLTVVIFFIGRYQWTFILSPLLILFGVGFPGNTAMQGKSAKAIQQCSLSSPFSCGTGPSSVRTGHLL